MSVTSVSIALIALLSFISQLSSLYLFTLSSEARRMLQRRFLTSRDVLPKVIEYPEHCEKWEEGEVPWNVSENSMNNTISTRSRIMELSFEDRLAFLFT